ncbi:MAG: hypothetical protein K2O04_04945 [Clostridiales bacterium]|nr:hypothetical protein [Clostridiales bacterium]
MVLQPWNGMLYAVPQGTAFFMAMEIDGNKIFQAAEAIILNMLVNIYAVERVAFGYEKPGEQVPIDLYLQHLQLGLNYDRHLRKSIPGVYIDENEHISTEYDYTEYVHDLFVYQMESIFFQAPKDVRLERDGKEIPLLPRFRDYLFGTMPLFTEVLNVKVEYNAFDVIPTDREARSTEYSKWARFVTAILLKPLRSGGKINRYVKDFTSAPHYISGLIEKNGKNFYLKPVNINSYEYIFALFSLMQFKNAENNKLLELKMLEWQRRHDQE